jgi:hypothetical protein
MKNEERFVNADAPKNRYKKTGLQPVFLSGHCLDVCVQATFMTSSLIGVDQTLARGTINTRNRIFKRLNGSFLVFGPDCLDHLLNEGTQSTPLRHVPLTMVFCLTCALTGLW